MSYSEITLQVNLTVHLGIGAAFDHSPLLPAKQYLDATIRLLFKARPLFCYWRYQANFVSLKDRL